MFWIDAILMLVMGWLGGVISTLLWRYVLEGRKPLDPTLIPKAAPPPLALPEVLPPPDFSPYAPKRPVNSGRSSASKSKLMGVWLQAKVERTTWGAAEPKPPKPPPLPRPPMPPPQPLPPAASPGLLPPIPWGG